MKPSCIVYTSNTGHTARYAELLSKITALPALSLTEATEKLTKGTSVIYLGWLFVGGIRGYKKAAKTYDMDHGALTGIYKHMIDVLIKFMRKKKNKSEGDQRMLYLLETGGDYVSEENLADVLRWYDSADDLA